MRFRIIFSKTVRVFSMSEYQDDALLRLRLHASGIEILPHEVYFSFRGDMIYKALGDPVFLS